jgi:ketosteroid isomerase-like protein
MKSASIAVALSLVALAPAASNPASPSAQVRAAEAAFAAAMEQRDLPAFESLVSAEAVFFTKEKALRGKAAVVAQWKQFFEAPAAPFSWAPETIEVLDSGRLALSSGPVYDRSRKLIGRFTSIWRLEDDGKWRVVFDKGCPVCP